MDSREKTTNNKKKFQILNCLILNVFILLNYIDCDHHKSLMVKINLYIFNSI